MVVQNLSHATVEIDVGANDSQDNTSEGTFVTIPSGRAGVVDPDRLPFGRLQIEDLLARGVLRVTSENPYDGFVWRKLSTLVSWPVSNDSGARGTGFRLVPRLYGGASTASRYFDEGVVVGSFSEVDFVGADVEATMAGSRLQVTIDADKYLVVTLVSVASYGLGASDRLLGVTYDAGPVAIALTTAAETGRVVTVKDQTGTVSPPRPITISPMGGQTVDGAAAFVLNRAWASVTLYADGAAWFVL